MQRIGRKRQSRMRWEALDDEAVRRNFAENVDQRFYRLPPKEADVETEWSLFRTSILGAATETCGMKRIGPPIGQKKIPWWNDEARAVVAEKKATYRAWVGRQTAQTRQKYLQTRDKTKEVVAKAKAISWKNFGHRLESDYLSAGKVFWQTIRRLRRGGCPMIYRLRAPLVICYLAKETSLIDGKNTLWNSTTQLQEGGEHRENQNGTRLVTSQRMRFRQL